jgi:hypothetical protein
LSPRIALLTTRLPSPSYEDGRNPYLIFMIVLLLRP